MYLIEKNKLRWSLKMNQTARENNTVDFHG